MIGACFVSFGISRWLCIAGQLDLRRHCCRGVQPAGLFAYTVASADAVQLDGIPFQRCGEDRGSLPRALGSRHCQQRHWRRNVARHRHWLLPDNTRLYHRRFWWRGKVRGVNVRRRVVVEFQQNGVLLGCKLSLKANIQLPPCLTAIFFRTGAHDFVCLPLS